MPRFRDDPSGGVFARLINVENFGLVRDENLPMATRMGEALGLVGTVGPLILLYYNPEIQEQPFGKEALELTAFSLLVYEPLIKLAGQFWDSLPPEGKADPTRKRGIDRMRQAAATSILAALTILGETDQYSRDDLCVRPPTACPDSSRPSGISSIPSAAMSSGSRSTNSLESHPDKEVRISTANLGEVLSPKAKTPPDDPAGPKTPKPDDTPPK